MKKNILTLCGFLLIGVSVLTQAGLIAAYVFERNMLLPVWAEEATYACMAGCYLFVYQLGMEKARRIYPLHIVAGVEAAAFTAHVFTINNLCHWLFFNHMVGIRYEDGWCSFAWIVEEDINHGVGRYLLVFSLLYVGCKVIDAVYLKKEFVRRMMAKLRFRRTHSYD